MHFMIDFENVRDRGLDGTQYLTPQDSVTIFYSRASQKISQGKLKELFDSGCNLSLCKLDNTGKNALDFWIVSRIGEIIGGGDYNGPICIVSNDTGFKSVRAYYQKYASPVRDIFIKGDILHCIVAANENSLRRKEIAQKIKEADIEKEFEKYQEKTKMRRELEKLFNSSEYAGMIEQIMGIVDGENRHKTIYLDSLKRFGRKQGVEIYRMLKQVI